MTDYTELILETKAFRNFRDEFRRGKNAHAFLFQCADRTFLKQFLAACACVVLCGNHGDFDCPVCRRILGGKHADVFFYPKGKGILVKDAEEILREVAVSSVEGKGKVFVLENMDEANTVVQNKLLKTLEEPPEGVTLLLGAVSDANMLTTVKSRCQRVEIERFSEDRILRYLTEQGVPAEEAEIAAASAFGNVSDAEIMVNDREYLALYRLVFEMLAEMNTSRDALRYVSALGEYKDRFSDVLDLLTSVLRDALVVQTSPELLFHRHKREEIQKISQNYSQQAILQCLDGITLASKKRSLNCNFNAVLDSLILGMLEVKQLCRVS